jgi:hypothetical protein
MEKTPYHELVFEWCKKFSEGSEDVENDELPDCLAMMKTDENVEQVRTHVRTDRCLGIRMIMEEVNVNKEMVRQILTTNQNIKKYLPK